MATRKSEWLASIKPILDKDGAKKDAAALAKELGDILEVKVDASPENLAELSKEFNAQLKTMGKQPIVFSEKTLRGIVTQFTNAISAGITAGVSKVDFSAQLDELNKKREKILKAKNSANQMMKSRTRMERLENFEIRTADLMPIDGDIAKEAQQLIKLMRLLKNMERVLIIILVQSWTRRKHITSICACRRRLEPCLHLNWPPYLKMYWRRMINSVIIEINMSRAEE